MKIVVCKDYDDVSRVMAEKVVEQIRKKPNLVFCLPAGELSYRDVQISCSDVQRGKG